MTNPTSVDISSLLVSAGIGVLAAKSGWSIHVSQEPEKPDQAITLYDTGSWREPHPALLLDFPSMQVKVRGAPGKYAEAHEKIWSIRELLLGLSPQTINGTYYSGVWVMSDIFHVANDENNRPMLTINFRISREPEQVSGDNRQPLS